MLISNIDDWGLVYLYFWFIQRGWALGQLVSWVQNRVLQ